MSEMPDCDNCCWPNIGDFTDGLSRKSEAPVYETNGQYRGNL